MRDTIPVHDEKPAVSVMSPVLMYKGGGGWVGFTAICCQLMHMRTVCWQGQLLDGKLTLPPATGCAHVHALTTHLTD
jgi:hypothetical protein